MMQFLQKLITLGGFLLSCGCFYLATTVTFITSFANIALFIIAIFFLIQGCGRLDKTYGYGKYSGNTESDKDEPEGS